MKANIAMDVDYTGGGSVTLRVRKDAELFCLVWYNGEIKVHGSITKLDKSSTKKFVTALREWRGVVQQLTLDNI